MEIMPDNWRAVNLFCFCDTQWQRNDYGQRMGLNYTALQSVFEMFRIPPRQHSGLITDVRLIELGALKQLADQAEKAHGT